MNYYLIILKIKARIMNVYSYTTIIFPENVFLQLKYK